MRGYERSWVRIDVLAGLAAGTVVVPQGMAYATIAGMPVEIGLYTCMLPMLAYALLGGSRNSERLDDLDHRRARRHHPRRSHPA